MLSASIRYPGVDAHATNVGRASPPVGLPKTAWKIGQTPTGGGSASPPSFSRASLREDDWSLDRDLEGRPVPRRRAGRCKLYFPATRHAPNVGPLLDLRTAFQHHRIMKMLPQDRVSRRARATLKMPCLIDRRFPPEESAGMHAVEGGRACPQFCQQISPARSA